ncbi:MAG: Glycosyl transferase family 39 [Candidatus Curtissbacteria bacterium GW2011_GWA1_41_11]|uniref:Polyprenol-phosphate-mannose--protein mannosyltransferase n=1 Tax=Candidatus Curtissbacteria bacterium GW2011_GWA1_41_11 TaxID=1618409 RepID=A0A0G0XDP8_9BACT|nr:MAG: Glycosyl transferase family 39 [Candidatus Curtissbacteria bacterium GW2011_GWA1_41_11]
MSKKVLIFITLITVFSLFLRLFRVTDPPRYYFDEVYHAVSAKAYADNNREAYNPFSPAPKEGTAYDWLHPPFAKLIQAGSIKVFGDVPLGWRLPSVLFGTTIIPLTFFLSYLLFGPIVAVFSATVIAFENLNFVMARITMNDVFLVFFMLCAFIFAVLYMRKKSFKNLFLTSIFLGFALATKWPGIYAIATVFGFLLINDLRKRIINPKLIILLVVPPLMYLASYSQYFLLGYNFSDFIELHRQIWWYQNRHDLEHTYGTTALFCVPHGTKAEKTWCPWILDARGVYFSYEQNGEKAGYIYALGNPLIFWAGIIAVSFVLGKFLEEKRKEYALILLGYFVFWVPWIFSPRLMFLYHYLPSLPFLAISLGVSLAAIYKTKFKYVSLAILLIFIAVFFYFYPISSGWPIKPASIDRYMWLSTWR